MKKKTQMKMSTWINNEIPELLIINAEAGVLPPTCSTQTPLLHWMLQILLGPDVFWIPCLNTAIENDFSTQTFMF